MCISFFVVIVVVVYEFKTFSPVSVMESEVIFKVRKNNSVRWGKEAGLPRAVG